MQLPSHEDDWADALGFYQRNLRAGAERLLLPMARQLRVIEQAERIADLRNRPDLQGEVGHWHASAGHAPRRFALLTLERVAIALDALESFGSGDPTDGFGIVLFATEEIARSHAYMTAMTHARDEHVRRGADGRRLIGATARERVRKAAQRHQGKVTREAAAIEIAEEVGRSPATVRRMLTSLFPGARWSAPGTDEGPTDDEPVA